MMARVLGQLRTIQAKAVANQEEMKAKMVPHHENLITIIKVGKEKMEAVREGCLESKKPSSEEMKSEAEHEEVAKEEAAMAIPAWRKEHCRQGQGKGKAVRRTQKGRTFGKRRRAKPEGITGIRNQG
jgi:hypothetical protein